MKQHKISWLNVPGYIPETLNPIIGCSKVSAGCQNCYAEKMASRICAMEYAGIMKGIPMSKAKTQYNRVMKDHGKHWCGYTYLVESQLEKPFRWKKPRAIFVCSMSDLFHENTKNDWIARVFASAFLNPQHLFILLTKRPERAEYVLKNEEFKWCFWKHANSLYDEFIKPLEHELYFYNETIGELPLKNVWIGVTAENQEQADKRIPILLQIPAKVRFVSCEPLLSAIDLEKWISPCSYYCAHSEEDYREFLGSNEFMQLSVDEQVGEMVMFYHKRHKPERSKLDWVIAGPETGPGARSCKMEWMENISQQCRDASVPFCDKRNMLGLRILEFPNFMGQ